MSDQPIGQDETRQGDDFTSLSSIGAMNRVLDALASWKKSNSVEPEFVIGLEVLFLYIYLYRVVLNVHPCRLMSILLALV